MSIIIGVCGIGYVGDAVVDYFASTYALRSYDKYKSIGSFAALLQTDLVFVCLPTPMNADGNYDTHELDAVLNDFDRAGYRGEIVIKSTVGPTYLRQMDMLHPDLILIHNPEFLTARTARQDFAAPRQQILGMAKDRQQMPTKTAALLTQAFPTVPLHIVDFATSALIKLGCNAFYATKVQFFTMLYLLSTELQVDFNTVRQLMLNQQWIHSMHTLVPGPDGDISFGGACLPKDTEALYTACQDLDVSSHLLAGVLTDQAITRQSAN